MLISLFSGTIASSYETFRLVLGLYFLVISAWLIFFLGKGSKAEANLFGLSYIGLLPFAMTLFTTQIREGLAMSLVLIGLALLQRAAPGHIRGWLLVAGSVLLTVLASTIHAGVLLFLEILLVSIGLYQLGRLCMVSPWTSLGIGTAASIVGITFTYLFGGLDWLIARFGAEFYGRPLGDPALVPTEKVVYWVCTAAITIYIAVKVRAIVATIGARSVYAYVLGYCVYCVLPLLQGVILLFLLRGYPGIIVSSAIRMYESVLFTSVLLISFSVRKTWVFVAIVTYLLADQLRVINTALGG